MPYVFYDTETTGTETAFDQILQFAAIKTDDDFVELDRFDIRCRLLPHIVPSPGALRVTKVTPPMLTNPALPSHYNMIRQIRTKLLEWSPATFIGYNSLAFDEDLLRQAFFQNLHPTYLTNTGGNSRGDIMRVSHAIHAYSPDSISVPIGDNGKQTFRLDRLAPANGYNHDQAHEAMADVEATIHMARLAHDRTPDIWQAMVRSVTKNAVKQHVIGESIISLTEYYFGRAYSWLVTYCGKNPTYDAQLAVFDLYHDPDDYRGLSIDELVGVLNRSPKVIRSLRANAQPILMPADTAPVKAIKKARKKDNSFFEKNPDIEHYEGSYIFGEGNFECCQRGEKCPTHVGVLLTGVAIFAAATPIHAADSGTRISKRITKVFQDWRIQKYNEPILIKTEDTLRIGGSGKPAGLYFRQTLEPEKIYELRVVGRPITEPVSLRLKLGYNKPTWHSAPSGLRRIIVANISRTISPTP